MGDRVEMVGEIGFLAHVFQANHFAHWKARIHLRYAMEALYKMVEPRSPRAGRQLRRACRHAGSREHPLSKAAADSRFSMSKHLFR